MLMVRMALTADDSLAAIRARNKFGMAIAAMIRMIATTISNSISEKPFCFRISCFPQVYFQLTLANYSALCGPEKELRKKPEITAQVIHSSWLRAVYPYAFLAERPPVSQFCVRFCRRVTNCVRLRSGDLIHFHVRNTPTQAAEHYNSQILNVDHRLDRFLRYTGFRGKGASPWGWSAAVICTVLFLIYSARLPSVRSNFLRPSWLKILALTVAITAAFCEESIFWKFLMDALQNHGFGILLQMAISRLVFGLAHAVWGLFRGSLDAALRVVSVTGVLGLALGFVYIVGDRVVAPCIVAHFLMNLFAEPDWF